MLQEKTVLSKIVIKEIVSIKINTKIKRDSLILIIQDILSTA